MILSYHGFEGSAFLFNNLDVFSTDDIWFTWLPTKAWRRPLRAGGSGKIPQLRAALAPKPWSRLLKLLIAASNMNPRSNRRTYCMTSTTIWPLTWFFSGAAGGVEARRLCGWVQPRLLDCPRVRGPGGILFWTNGSARGQNPGGPGFNQHDRPGVDLRGAARLSSSRVLIVS